MKHADYMKLINVSATPSVLPKWFQPYTNWRFVGLPFKATKQFPRPPHPKNITITQYGWVLDEWDRFALWDAWVLSGRKGPRPIGLWLNAQGKPISPAWAVTTRKWVQAYRAVKPVPPPPPLPPPPHDYDVSLGFSWIVMAQDPVKAIDYPSYYGVMFTADHAYEKPSASIIKHLRDRGQRVRSWCDCHTTFPETAKKMAVDYGLDGWCGEGESSYAFQVGMDAGAELMIVNLSALLPDQKDKYISTRKTVCINELYLNQDSSRAARENWENLPIAGRLIACYDAASECDTGRYFSFPEYQAINKYAPHHDSFYDPGAHDGDRALVP